jgi:hypothetical protein
MPDWAQSLPPEPDALHPLFLAYRLVAAFGLGVLVAAIYRGTTGSGPGPAFRVTLVLLTILITAVTQVIGDNVARAFSLVGALSIVRFRTVVRGTRDTAFVIFAVTVGMAVGAGDFWVAGQVLVVVGVAAVVAGGRAPGPPGGDFELIITATLGGPGEAALAQALSGRIATSRMVGAATANRGSALETTYQVSLREECTPAALVDALNDLEGVLSVQIRILDR